MELPLRTLSDLTLPVYENASVFKIRNMTFDGTITCIPIIEEAIPFNVYEFENGSFYKGQIDMQGLRDGVGI